MRALTLWQPWAEQIFASSDAKDIENRTTLRPPPELLANPRPYFAIHAGKVYDRSPAEKVSATADASGLTFPSGARVPLPDECTFGAVIGVAKILYGWDGRTKRREHMPMGCADYVEITRARSLQQARWWLGPIGIALTDVHRIEPLPCRGALGYWNLTESDAMNVMIRAEKAGAFR